MASSDKVIKINAFHKQGLNHELAELRRTWKEEKDISTRKKWRNEYVKVLRPAKAQHFSNKASKLSQQGRTFQVIKNRDNAGGKIKALDPITKKIISD